MDFASKDDAIRAFYHHLYKAWGRQHWWPARSRFEVIVGAILTQNTSWKNVELALDQLRAHKALSLKAVRELPLSELESLICPAGFFRQKARYLENFTRFVDDRYRSSLSRMFRQSTDKLRDELLNLKGIGPETADSILLYAGQHPVFVVDAYTRRILDRHGILPAKSNYEDIRRLFERSLANPSIPPGVAPSHAESTSVSHCRPTSHPPTRMSSAKRSDSAQVFNEMHGLIVVAGKHHCLKSRPRCESCPLYRFLPKAD